MNISFLYFLSVRWRKLNSSPVCFGAKNNHFGRFYVPVSRLAAIKLVHLYGYVSCDTRHTSNWSYWGCGDKMQAQVSVTITTTANRILLPPKQFLTIPSLEWYKIPGYNSVSPELILSVLSTPNWISSDQELLLWYGEDLVNFSEEDNGGTVCVNEYALFVWKEAVISRRCSTGWKKCHEEKENQRMEMWNVQPSIYGRFLIIEKYNIQRKHSCKLRLPPSPCPLTI